jgi:hypothetical protein
MTSSLDILRDIGAKKGPAKILVGRQGARRSATPNRRSARESSITPPSEDIRPPSNAAATFFPWRAGNENSGIVSSVMPAVAGAKVRKGFV